MFRFDSSTALEHLNLAFQGQALEVVLRDPAFWKLFADLGWRNQERLLQSVCQRVDELSLEARVSFVCGLQRGPTPRRSELAIRDIFLATEGPDLTRLKRKIDGQGDYHDLVQLLYHDIDDASIRRQILDHFATQARACPCSELRVLSDLDDTFYRNWRDPRFPEGVVYPGALQLFHELDFPQPDSEPGDIVFLTGRVGERSGFLENRYRKQLAALGARNFTVLTGSLVHQFVWPLILQRKWYNFERHRQVFPEMGMVMFGDTGQADPEFLLRARERYPAEVRAALLHSVVPLTPQRRERCEKGGVLLYETYLGAAVQLFLAGCVSAEAMHRVGQACSKELLAIPFANPAVREARLSELERDLGWARSLTG